MARLKGFQKKHLKGIAHGMKPVVFIGQKGMTDALAAAINEALDAHELIKVRFVDLKEKPQKDAIVIDIEREIECEVVGRIGHVVTLYRQHTDPKKRRVAVPQRAARKQQA